MATDTQAMGLLIRMMPLMMREFALRVDPLHFFADSGYAASILDAAAGAKEPRLNDYARQLRARMSALGAGPPGAARSAPTAAPAPLVEPTSPTPEAATDPGDTPVPPRKYLRSLR